MTGRDVESRLESLFAGAPVVAAPAALRQAVVAARTEARGTGRPLTAVRPSSSIRHGRLGRTVSALVGLAATLVVCVGLLFFVANRATVGPAASAAAGAFSLTGSMAASRYMAASVLLNDGRVLVIGGWADVTGPRLATAELYDPATGKFTAAGSMAHARGNPTATLLRDGRVLVTGGDVARSEADSSAELYDPSTGRFSATGSMSSARAGETATLLSDGRVLIVGGANKQNGALASAELYDPATGTFSATGSMAQARMLQSACLLRSGRVLVVGGDDGSRGYLATAELYDPATGTFTATGSMADARAYAPATVLTDGRVLFAGGQGGAGDLATAEVYDPANGRFTQTGAMSVARTNESATLLPDGRVLVAGGMYVSEPDTKAVLLINASAELYDPSTGRFSATGSMSLPRDGHTATLLRDGRVLVAGGRTATKSEDGSGLDMSMPASAELYVPQGNRPTSSQSATPSLRLARGMSWEAVTAQALIASKDRLYAFLGTSSGPTVWSSVDGIAWQQLAGPSAFGAGVVDGETVVTAAVWLFDGTIVAVGYGPDGSGASIGRIWRSEDGRAWQQAELDQPAEPFYSIAQRKGVCLAIGGAPYVSTDAGQTWMRSYQDGIVPTPAPSTTAAPDLPFSSGRFAVTAWQGGFIALGPAATRQTAWLSPDGHGWTPADGWNLPAGAITLASFDEKLETLVALATTTGPTGAPLSILRWSTDGRSWAEGIRLDGSSGFAGAGTTADLWASTEPAPPPLMVVVGQPSRSDGPSTIGGASVPLWVSREGRTWQRLTNTGLPDDGAARYLVAVVGSRIVLLGGAGTNSAWSGNLASI